MDSKKPPEFLQRQVMRPDSPHPKQALWVLFGTPTNLGPLGYLWVIIPRILILIDFTYFIYINNYVYLFVLV